MFMARDCTLLVLLLAGVAKTGRDKETFLKFQWTCFHKTEKWTREFDCYRSEFSWERQVLWIWGQSSWQTLHAFRFIPGRCQWWYWPWSLTRRVKVLQLWTSTTHVLSRAFKSLDLPHVFCLLFTASMLVQYPGTNIGFGANKELCCCINQGQAQTWHGRISIKPRGGGVLTC